MDDTKLPFKFKPDPDLQNLSPLSLRGSNQPSILPVKQNGVRSEPSLKFKPPQKVQKDDDVQQSPVPVSPAQLSEDDFPPLGATTRGRRRST